LANEYIELVFENISANVAEILVAALNEEGFDGFEEEGETLKAFIDAVSFDEIKVKAIADKWQLSFSKTIIVETNWNDTWESSFQPVIIDNIVAIRAAFHQPVTGVKDEIIITPKMSFGTGHHATTWLMISQMSEIDFVNKSVLDFGTGTGILALYAERRGARHVLAIDNDDWSITNAKENLVQNNSQIVEIRKASTVPDDQQFDIILANINRNIILDSTPGFAKQLKQNGTLLLSGLLVDDEKDVINTEKHAGFTLKKRTDRHNWLCLKLSAC
jgi:ribosomal protein L11 methyltransferase